MEMPKDIEGWIKLAKDDPLAYTAAYMDLTALSFCMPSELKGPIVKALPAVIRSRLKTASREVALVFRALLNNLITAKEEGATEAARRMIDEIDELLGSGG